MDPGAAADLVAAVHLAYVVFVVAGQGLILVGGPLAWACVRDPWFRGLHLAAIGAVVAEVVLGVYCPLTLLEARLRRAAVDHEAGFIAAWIERLLYYDIALWQAHLAYLAFAAVTLWSWWRYPPRWR
jgi:hypothetical protein